MSEKLLSRMAVAIYVNNIGLDHYVPRETVTETFEDAIMYKGRAKLWPDLFKQFYLGRPNALPILIIHQKDKKNVDASNAVEIVWFLLSWRKITLLQPTFWTGKWKYEA